MQDLRDFLNETNDLVGECLTEELSLEDSFDLVDVALALGKVKPDTKDGKHFVSAISNIVDSINKKEDIGSSYPSLIKKQIAELNKILKKIS